MREQLEALAELAQIDHEAQTIDASLGDIPKRLKSFREHIATLSGLLSAEQSQVSDADRTAEQQRQAVAAGHESMSRAKAKAAQSRTAREVEAAERELEATRRTIREREDEATRLDAALAKAKELLAKHQSELQELEAMHAEEASKGESLLSSLDGQRSAVEAKRATAIAPLSPETLMRYERIRKRRGTGVSVVRNGSCTACRVVLPSMVATRVRRGEEIVECPSCMRLMLDAKLVPDPPDEPEDS